MAIDIEKRVNVSREDLRSYSVNEVVKNNPNATDNVDNFVKMVGKEFIKNKLYAFPALCTEARRVNWIKEQNFMAMDNKGWSKSKEFKLDYVIPKELYLFMINMVYIKFWNEENEKVWRSFMKALCRGDDPEGLLRRVKTYYLSAERPGGH